MEDEEAALNITPAFKSRSSKGKGRAGSSRVVDDDAGASTKQDSNSSLGLANDDDDDDDAANSSAVLFKKSASKSKGKSLLGGSTTSSSAARKTGSRSRLNVSFGGDVDDGGDDREPVTSRQSSAGMDMADDGADPEGDVSVSEVRKINRKNRKLGGIGSSSLTKTAEKWVMTFFRYLSCIVLTASLSHLCHRLATTSPEPSQIHYHKPA